MSRTNQVPDCDGAVFPCQEDGCEVYTPNEPQETTYHFMCFQCDNHLDLDTQYIKENTDDNGYIPCPNHSLSSLVEVSKDECYYCKQ